MMSVRLLRFAVLFCLLPVSGWADAVSPPLSGLASEVWQAVGTATSLAVRPVDADETGLPDLAAQDLSDDLTAALLERAPLGRRVVARGDLPRVWDEAMSFHSANTQALLRSAAVDVLILPRVVLLRDGMALSVVLTTVAGSDAGRVLAVLGPVTVPRVVGPATTPDIAARRAGVALAEHIRLTVDPGASVLARVRRTGVRNPMADWFLDQVANHLARRLAQRPVGMTRPLRHMSNVPIRLDLTLEGEVWDMGDRIDVQLRADSLEGEARVLASMTAAALPARFRPLTRDGGRLGGGMYQGEGVAEAGRGLRFDELGMAALTAARGRVVADALDLRQDLNAIVSDHAGIAAGLRILERGLPYDARWRVNATTANRLSGLLRAKVVRLGGGDAPLLEATIDRQIYYTGDSLRISARVSGGRAYLALYVWQADASVVRLWPSENQAAIVSDSAKVVWPGLRDVEVAVAPMPGVPQSTEAVVVVASAVPFNADRLAPVLGSSAGESLATASHGSAFLDQLAALDTARITLKVLPYRVRAVP